MPITLTPRGREVFATVEVRDPSGQRRAALGPLPRSTTMAEIRGRAQCALHVQLGSDYNLRCESTGRLLNDQQRLDSLQAADQLHYVLALQPDAALG
jgi:hypothetical protein